MRTLILARHGESEYSARNLCNGDPTVPVPLTARGREEAKRLGTELAGEPIDLCVTSEFPRTRETADIALRGREIPRIALPELNDINYGALEGETRERYHAWFRQHGWDARLPGGESRSDVAHRVSVALDFLLGRSEQIILAIAHDIVLELVRNAAEDRAIAGHRDSGYATPHWLSAEAVAGAATRLAAWHAPA